MARLFRILERTGWAGVILLGTGLAAADQIRGPALQLAPGFADAEPANDPAIAPPRPPAPPASSATVSSNAVSSNAVSSNAVSLNAVSLNAVSSNASDRKFPVVPATRPSSTAEAIREYHRHGELKTEWHVARNAQGRLVPHGPWATYDESGQRVGAGRYEFGERTGAWERRYRSADEAEVLSSRLKRQFTAPFTSTAEFKDGKLHGTWRIVDSRQREVFSWSYADGKRHGPNVWRYPNGQVWREMTFSHGQLTGELHEFDTAGQLLVREVYVYGRRLVTKVETYADGAKQAEAQFLLAKEVSEDFDDWWRGISRSRVLRRSGQDERHGDYVAYYENGQRALAVRYNHDHPVGTVTWWHPNGRRAIVGEYHDNELHGEWTWWYPSGEVRLQGHYNHGTPDGYWTCWNEEGLLTRMVQISEPSVMPASGNGPSMTSNAPAVPAPAPRLLPEY